jgi:DNA replication protein DnaC
VRTLLEGAFVKDCENVLAFGKSGSGKTHLLCAISQELIRLGYNKVYFSPCSLLVHDLLIAKLGYVQQSREEMEVLFTLLAERYERGSVMITSNLPSGIYTVRVLAENRTRVSTCCAWPA